MGDVSSAKMKFTSFRHLKNQKAKLPESGAKRANSAPEEEKIKLPNYADGAGEKGAREKGFHRSYICRQRVTARVFLAACLNLNIMLNCDFSPRTLDCYHLRGTVYRICYSR